MTATTTRGTRGGHHAGEPDRGCGLHAGGSGRAVPLLGVEVRAEVVAGHSCATVRQRYRNDEAKPIEAIYTFPLPTRGAITGFAMSVNGRSLVGEVHEREEAFRRYDDALSAGHGGALLEQERPNVFTANVGNLLPGEETVIEIAYVEPVTAEEGAIRWTLPTLVAPRYIPGALAGDRTAHGSADPTSRVPDADRISPPIGAAPYGLSLELTFDVGGEMAIESPSHEVRSEHVGGRTRVTFAQPTVALDRDVVISAFPKESASAAAPLASVVAHRSSGGSPIGTFALTLVPDLAGGLERREGRSEVVFLLDRSGSMEGVSITEAKTALRLCLRQLREGDRFAVIAFDDSIDMMSASMTTLTPSSLRAADAWIDGIDARGGTEILEPLLRATELAPNGVLVLLTDGQVGNEEEIERELLARRGTARIHSFGIGTNVSDALLVALAEKTGGAVEMIHPGERVDDKVVAQFARATAPRVTGLEIAFRSVDVGEVAPAEPIALVDGEPLTIFGTYEAAGVGVVELRGTYEGEKFYLEVPLDLPEHEDRPAVTKLWAQARIRDLERASLVGRRADAMKERIVKLAKEHGVSSRYTSFIVVEKRSGERRTNEQADTRVVTVNAPADWAMTRAKAMRSRSHSMVMKNLPAPAPMAAMPAMRAMPAMGAMRPMSGGPPPPRAPGAMARPAASMPPSRGRAAVASPSSDGRGFGGAERDERPTDPAPPMASAKGRPPAIRAAFEAMPEALSEEHSIVYEKADSSYPRAPSSDLLTATLERQAASGLWEERGRDVLEVTVEALLVLVRLGISTSHPVHGAQTKKAVDALLDALGAASEIDPRLAELAFAALWLLSTGRRTRTTIRNATAGRPHLETLAAALARDEDVRARVERLAPAS